MTDNELAAELEFYKGNEDLISPALIAKAAERIYALSANCSLLKASLAQAERESEAALSALAASAEPFGYFRFLPLSGWEDCAETDEGAIPLYERPQPAASAEPVAWAHFAKNGNIRIWTSAAKEAVRIAKENGIDLMPLYTAPQPAANAEPAIPAFDCWSSGDGECWHLHPADACILDDVFSDGAPKVGDEYEVLAGWRSVEARYRITSVYEDGGVDVECISHAREAAPQPDRVAELTAEVERLRTQVAAEHVVARATVYARIDAENELREARAAVAAEREACADLVQGWNTAMTDKLADAIRARGENGGEKC